MHTCPLCALKFNQYFLYQMHKEDVHNRKPKALPGIKKPYTQLEKATIVDRLEAKLGKHNFFGGNI
jgi:hypothetical protein